MRTYDLSPLFRSTVGFDRLSALLEAANRSDASSNAGNGYPPYNIEKHGEEAYAITVAVAGFKQSDLDIQLHDQTLTIRGRIGGFDASNPKLKAVGNDANGSDDDAKPEFLHRGIATREFERRFQLADHIKVGPAALDHGLLRVSLVREVPEALKPRTIAISSSSPTAKGQTIDAEPSAGNLIENAAA